MNDYKLCLVKFREEGRPYLFKAPNDWRVEKGKKCMAEGSADIGTITNVLPIYLNSVSWYREAEAFITEFNRNREIANITQIIDFTDLEYE